MSSIVHILCANILGIFIFICIESVGLYGFWRIKERIEVKKIIEKRTRKKLKLSDIQ